MARKTRSKTVIWLVGPVNSSFLQTKKLPSLREILAVFFYHHKNERLTLRESATRSIKEVSEFWVKGGIPTMCIDNAVGKLLDVYAEWQGIKKSMKRRTESQVKREQTFSQRLDSLFDIAHRDAESLINIKEDLHFWHAQRSGRTGYMAGVDKKLANKELLTERKKQSDKNRHERSQKVISEMSQRRIELESSTDQSEDESPDHDDQEYQPKFKRPKIARRSRLSSAKTLVTKEVSTALDRIKVTDREAPHLLAATAQALGHDPVDLPLSRSSIRRRRMQQRTECASNIKLRFKPDTQLVVHWDSKLLPDIVKKKKVDRLPVIVTGISAEQLLGVPKIASSTGENQASAVLNCLDEWNIRNNVKGMSFDTTASNTGQHSGACCIIEQSLGRPLLHLACRHHIMEIIAEKAFSSLNINISSGPEITLFSRFQKTWSEINKRNFETAGDRKETASFKEHVISFAKGNMKTFHPRDDYRELLELTIIFLGGQPDRGIRFQAPGALHQARWMARIIYSFKIWMFKSQFKLAAAVERGIYQFLIFICKIYIRAWFEAPSAVSAPANDFRLLSELMAYNHSVISKATTAALMRHLWYLSEVTVGLAFFDSHIDSPEKLKMVRNLQQKRGTKKPPPRLDCARLGEKTSLSAFVTKNTSLFFKILNTDMSFLKYHPDTWKTDAQYQEAEKIVRALKVVNDTAERGVQLIRDYNNFLTNSEEQKQYLLQVVKEHRAKFPDSKKTTIVSGLKENPV